MAMIQWSGSPATDTYAAQTDAREAYYKANPAKAPTFTAPEQASLTQISQPGPVATAPFTPPPAAQPSAGSNAQDIIRQWQQAHGPNEPLTGLIEELKRNGHNAEAFMYGATPSGNEIQLNGQQYKVKTGDNASWWTPSMGEGGASSYMSAFTDPATQYMEQYYKAQLGTFQQQQQAQQQANEALKARMPEIQAATQRLVDYLTSRATQLQGAPYTGTEQEILRTQALDPIEQDRQAAQQRALENISARGLTPESGISQALMNQVDAGYDKTRAGAQNDLAYKTINEQRSRQQEAQQLLASIPQIQRAGAMGDLSFLQALDAAVNANSAQGAGMVQQLQRLPSLALADANATLGTAPNAASAYQSAATTNQASQANNAAFWEWFFSQF